MKPLNPPNIPHDPLDDLIAAALHGDLSPEERAHFDARLAGDPAAQAAYQEAQAMHDLLEKTNHTARPDADFEQRMVSAVRRKLAQPAQRETAWESAKILTDALRRGARMVWRHVGFGGALTLVVIALIVCGVALGPITNGVKQARANAELQRLREQQMLADEQQQDVPGATPKSEDNQPVAMNRPIHLPSSPEQQIVPPVSEHATDANAPSIIENREFTAQGGRMTVHLQPPAAFAMTPTAPAPAGAPVFANDLKAPADVSNMPVAKATPDALQRRLKADVDEELATTEKALDNSSPAKMITQQSPPARTFSAPVPDGSAAPLIPASTAASSAPPAAPAPEDNRKLIRDAQLTLEVKSYQATVDQVTALAKADGGYVDTSASQRGGNGKLQGTVVVKVLPQDLDGFLLKLRDLGTVKDQSIGTQDVTKDYYDTQARLVNAQKMEAQLQDLLKRENGKVSDLLAVERELGRVRGEIEQMQGQLKLYDFQVQYATVTIQIAEKDLKSTAAYLLKEIDDFSLFATNVEATFQEARELAVASKAEVLVAKLEHDSGSEVGAVLVLSVPPDQIEPFLEQVRALGRVANFTRDTKRVAQDGGDPDHPADETLTEKDKVTVNLSIRSDNDSRKQVALTVVAGAVDDALQRAKAAALAQAGVEILGSALNQAPQGPSTARLTVRVPGPRVAAVLDAFRALGRASSLTVRRNDDSGPGASGDDAPVILALSLTDTDTPVQRTDLVISANDVDAQAQQVKKDAGDAGMQVEASNFHGESGGAQSAQLTVRLPLGKYPAFLERLKTLGRVKSLTVQRNDDNGPGAADATAAIVLTLVHDGSPVQQTDLSIVADDVDAQAQQIKRDAAAAGAEVKTSSFERQPDGTETAQMTLRVPLGKYAAYVATLQKAGKVESLSVHRDDRPGDLAADDTAPAEIALTLHNIRAIVADNDGLWATLRGTFGDGFAALFGSVRVIGVLIAFALPWVVTLGLLAWLARRVYVWRNR